MTQDYINLIKGYYYGKIANLNYTHCAITTMGKFSKKVHNNLILATAMIDILDRYQVPYDTSMYTTTGAQTVTVETNGLTETNMEDLIEGINRILDTNLYKKF